MGFRFQSALQVANIADEMIENQFEVIMPKLNIDPNSDNAQNTSVIKSLFSLSLPTSYQPIVEAINFGVRNFKTTTRRIRTGWINIAEDIENYEDVALTMFCSSGLLTQYYLAAWKALIFDPVAECYNPCTYYKKDIHVFFYGPGGVASDTTATGHMTLHGCFPYKQDKFKLQYASEPQRLRITQTFKVDKVTFDTTTAKSSIVQELLTSPLSILDGITTDFTNNYADYDITDVYD